MLIGLAFLLVTGILVLSMLSNQRRDARAAAVAMSDSVATRLRFALEIRMAAITQMTRRLERASPMREEEWQSDADSYIHDIPGIVALELLDSSCVVRWVAPQAGNEAVVGRNFSDEPTRGSLLRSVIASRSPAISPAVELYAGGREVLLAAPIRGAAHDSGFLVAAVDVDVLFSSLLLDRTAPDYDVAVFEGNQRLYGRADPGALWIAQSDVDLGGPHWTVKVRPGNRGGLSQWSPLIAAVAVAGVIVSLLLSVSVGFAQASVRRARESELVKRTLEQEMVERRRSEEAVRENEERFRLAFGNAPIGMALVTTDGRWLRVNKALCDLLGYRESELLARDFQSLTHPEDVALDVQLLKRVLEGEIDSYTVEKRYLHKSARVVHASLHVSFVRSQAGGAGYFVSQIEDISQRIEMDRVRNAFISIVSHELRTPLTSIAGSLGLLAGGVAGALPSKASHLVAIAERNSQRLVRLANDILDIEKAAAGKLEFELEVQELEPIVRHAIEANQEYASGLGVRIELASPGTNVLVRVDRDRLTQVLTNLISNAAKFSPPGERVTLGIRRQGMEVEVWVRDRGPGIPEDFRDRIFQQFAQADNSDARRKGGAGLGLSIAKALVERLGGSIDYSDINRPGATFFVTLPIYTRSD